MKKTVVLALLFTMSCCVAVTAQTFSLITGREPVTSLDGLWRFHTGDNPAWASPDFDDSQWPSLSLDGSFTCCPVLISTDEKLIIANAGHLAPYLNGEELAVNPGLPLGIADGTAYAESAYDLGQNDRLTFLSDGVVEARNNTGTLFGFARAAALSIQPAEDIAQTAQQWGQKDDITVLTVMRAEKLETVTA